VNRELSKFLAGSVAGLAFVHVAYAVTASVGITDEPVFFGKKWKVKYMWTEAAVYAAVSLALGYVGWFSKPQEQPQEPTTSAVDGQSKQPVGPSEESVVVSR
jgi:hypothetical protein